jgi:hypothetical protein
MILISNNWTLAKISLNFENPYKISDFAASQFAYLKPENAHKYWIRQIFCQTLVFKLYKWE